MGDQVRRRRTRITGRTSALLAFTIGLAACGSGAAGAPPTIGPAPAVTSTPAAATPAPTRRVVVATPAPAVEPLADEILGAWYESAPGFWWFFRAGDPLCVKAVRTDRDCLAYELVGQPAAIGSAWMSGRILHVDWVRGYCGGRQTLFGTGLEGNTLKFFDQPGDCGGDSWTMTRAGTGSAPTAPPAPAP